MEKPLHEKICLSWIEADWLFYSQKQGWMHMLVFALLFDHHAIPCTPCFPCTDPGFFVGGGGGGGGGGGPGPTDKKSPDNVFLVLSLFYWSQMVDFEENYHFSRFQWGSNIFHGGGPTFSRGVQLLIPYRNLYNLWFSMGYRTMILLSKQWRQATPRADPEGG